MYRLLVLLVLLIIFMLPQQQVLSESGLQYEKIAAEYKMILEIPNPPLRVGENVYYIRLYNAKTKLPINTQLMIVKLGEQIPKPQEPMKESQWIKAPTVVQYRNQDSIL